MDDLIMEKEDCEETIKELDQELKENEKAKLKMGEKRALIKNACLKPEKWQNFQKEKEDTCKNKLDATSPAMRNFFQEIDISMKQATSIISRVVN